MIEIIRGTTPSIDVELENLDSVKDIEFSLKQNANGIHIALIKTLKAGEIEMHDTYFRVNLSEVDTFKFSAGSGWVQIRLLSFGNKISSSEEEEIEFLDSLSHKTLSTGGTR
jgi:hypothetical protein